MKSGRLLPLCALALWGLFSCKALPQAEPSGGVSPEYGDEGFGEEDRGGYDYEGWDMPEEEPSLALPPGLPDDAWPGDLIEPSWESGEAFLPDSPPEESALVLAEPLPEPVPPDLTEAPPPEPAGEPSPEGELAGDLSAPREPAAPEEPLASEETAAAEEAAGDEAPAAGEEPPPPALPPPPPRIVRPSEPVPPPPPVREPLPMPPASVPDLPARNPPTLTPEASPGVSSRTVRALAGQTVEVPFRGTGWVYLGESSSKRGLDYASRRLDGEGQTFVFRAVEAGVYELKFYRQDFIRDYIINDRVTVMVEEPSLAVSRSGAVAERVVAEPRWPTLAGRTTPGTGDAGPGTGDTAPGTGTATPAAGAAASGTGTATPAAGAASGTGAAASAAGAATPAAGTAVSGTGSAAPAARAGRAAPGAAGTPEAAVAGSAVPGGAPAADEAAAGLAAAVLPQDTAAEEYLRRAREEYQGERYPQATAILDQFLERFPLGSDEAYWLYAQICEKQGPSRNIRLALDYYRRLTAEYPQSGHYGDARRRIAYLERYYLNIQ